LISESLLPDRSGSVPGHRQSKARLEVRRLQKSSERRRSSSDRTVIVMASVRKAKRYRRESRVNGTNAEPEPTRIEITSRGSRIECGAGKDPPCAASRQEGVIIVGTRHGRLPAGSGRPSSPEAPHAYDMSRIRIVLIGAGFIAQDSCRGVSPLRSRRRAGRCLFEN
jgi:hypothetical protein